MSSTRSSSVTSFILPPSTRGSMNVPRPTLVMRPGRPAAISRHRLTMTPCGRQWQWILFWSTRSLSANAEPMCAPDQCVTRPGPASPRCVTPRVFQSPIAQPCLRFRLHGWPVSAKLSRIAIEISSGQPESPMPARPTVAPSGMSFAASSAVMNFAIGYLLALRIGSAGRRTRRGGRALPCAPAALDARAPFRRMGLSLAPQAMRRSVEKRNRLTGCIFSQKGDACIGTGAQAPARRQQGSSGRVYRLEAASLIARGCRRPRRNGAA